jgi:hypothetical protein
LGRYDFKSLSDYLAVRINRFRQTLPGFDPQDLVFNGYQQELAFFVTDQIKISRQFSATLGLRWEGQWNPQPTRPNPAAPATGIIPNDLNMWQPRAGLTWAPGRGSTVIRMSAGLFSARTPANLFQRVNTDNGITTQAVDSKNDPAVLNFVKFPLPLPPTALPPGVKLPAQRIFGFMDNFRNPQSAQISVMVEQSIGQDFVLSAGYLRNSTWHLQRRLDRNLYPPTIDATGMPIFPKTRPNPNPNIGWLGINESSAHSSYDGLIVTATRRFARRYQIQANYTYSKTYDDDSNERNFSRELALNPFDLTQERAHSKQDIRQNFNVNGLVQLPWGMQFSGILLARSGLPFNPVIGFDTQNDTNDDNDRAIINGRVAARNSLRQPSFFNLDLRLMKVFLFGEKRQLQLTADGFNITKTANRNFGVDGISAYGTPDAPVTTAGQPLYAPSTARFGGPRQLQLGARFTF